MLSHVEFKSGAFPKYETEAEEVNPDRFGKRLAEYLRDALRARGETIGALLAEDWGWIVPIENESFRLSIGVGNYEKYPDGFLCFIEPHTEFVRKLFKKIPVVDRVDVLRKKLDDALQSHESVNGIKWSTHGDFNSSAT